MRQSLRRGVLLSLVLLSACAAGESPRADASAAGRRNPQAWASGVAGAFVVGRFAADQGDLETAAQSFKDALALDPSSPEIRAQAFLTALLAGRSDAIRLARGISDVNPIARMVLADQDAAAGRWEGAEARYASLQRQGITQILQPLLVAWAQFGGGRTDAALATLRPFSEGDRLKAIYTLNAAMIADAAGRTREAGRMYETARSQFGQLNLELGRAQASFQARMGQKEEAARTIRALASASQDLNIAVPALIAAAAQPIIRRPADGLAESYLFAAIFLRDQDVGELVPVLLRQALNLRPDLTAARLMQSDVLEQQRHFDAALAVLQPVGSADPLAPLVQLRRAALMDRAGETDSALRELANLQAAHPDRAEPWALQGNILRQKHRFGDAAAAYDRAVALVPNPSRANWPLFYERGIARERSRDWPGAEADFMKALQLSPDEPSVLNYLGYSWTEQGRDLARARAMIERAAQARPNDGAIIDSLGWVTFKQGDVAGAVRQLEKAAELEPEDATINGHLGDAYFAAGRRLEALYQWRRALTLNPEPEDVPKLEAKLKDAEQAEANASGPQRQAQP